MRAALFLAMTALLIFVPRPPEAAAFVVDVDFDDIGFAAGLGDVGNAEAGVRLLSDAFDNLIQGNRILNNGGAGVELVNGLLAGNTSEFAPARSLGEVLFRDGYEN